LITNKGFECFVETLRLNPGDIELGCPLPWAVYSTENSLLLQEGTTVNSERQLRVLLEKGLYRGLTEEEIEQNTPQGTVEKVPELNPFAVKDDCATQLAFILKNLEQGNIESPFESITHLCKQIQSLCKSDADAALGAVHFCRKFQYSTLHPIHTAILCELLGRRIKYTVDERISLLAAALTMNVGMLDLQDSLYNQHVPLTAEQRKAIHDHPQQSVKLIEQVGITDSVWIDTIRQHHEKVDGSGYPSRLSGKKICFNAKILSLTDMYAALVTPRKNRKPVLVKEVLKSIFLGRGKLVDEDLSNQLIREVGIFPPGTAVRLLNGDVAIVTKRAVVKKNRDSMAPTVKSIVSPRGGPYEEPQRRDCSNPLFKIEKMCVIDRAVSIDLLSLWGYQNSGQKETGS